MFVMKWGGSQMCDEQILSIKHQSEHPNIYWNTEPTHNRTHSNTTTLHSSFLAVEPTKHLQMDAYCDISVVYIFLSDKEFRGEHDIGIKCMSR